MITRPSDQERRVRMTPYRLNAEHALASEGNFPSEDRKIPGWLLDKIAEEKLSGGYGKRNRLCPNCRILKSCSGSCGCE